MKIRHALVWVSFFCVVAVAAAAPAGDEPPQASPPADQCVEPPSDQATPPVCANLSCPALLDQCVKDGDQRACALHNLCC